MQRTIRRDGGYGGPEMRQKRFLDTLNAVLVLSVLLALLPVLTSTGRGADVMVPMATPSFGGMTVAVITMFVVPVLYSALAERRALQREPRGGAPRGA